MIEDAQINSVPSSLTLGQPLLEIHPHWERLEELGFRAGNFGFAVAALGDGAFVDEFYLNDDKIDMFLFSEAADRQELSKLESLPIFTPQGTVMPLGSLATITETVDTAEIRRGDGKRTVTLYVIPPRSVPLVIIIVLFGLGFTALITLTFLPSMLILVLNLTARFRRARR